MTATLDAPAVRRHRCGADILTVIHAYGAINIEATPIPVGHPLDGLEHHPLHGWHFVWEDLGFQRRGHPVHALHTCNQGANA